MQHAPASPALEAHYTHRRGQIAAYFDRTAADAWAKLTSDAPVGSIRATVRAGRDTMRSTLLDWLPADLHGARVLDAGCGTGALALELARRGADVVAIDLSPTLVDLARDRADKHLLPRIQFASGDMLDPAWGDFDHVVWMDSLIHYDPAQAVAAIAALAPRTRASMLFTFAPATAWLMPMMAVGRLFPKGNRAPSIVPVRETDLRGRLQRTMALGPWDTGRTLRVSSGFYTSQALELRHREAVA